jgi:hypothetical protein
MNVDVSLTLKASPQTKVSIPADSAAELARSEFPLSFSLALIKLHILELVEATKIYDVPFAAIF